MLLEELEDEIDRWQKDFAPTASTSSVHDEFNWFPERPRRKATDLASKVSPSCFVFCGFGRVSWIVKYLVAVSLFFTRLQDFALVGQQPALGYHLDIGLHAPKNKLIPFNLILTTLFSTSKPTIKYQGCAGHNLADLRAFPDLLRSFQSRLLPLHQKWSPWLQMAPAPRLPLRPYWWLCRLCAMVRGSRKRLHISFWRASRSR
jgi:hypothetical protein